MDDYPLFSFYLVLWLVAAGGTVAQTLRRSTPTCGLVLAYILHLWTFHWAAMPMYLLPWYFFYDPHLVFLGFAQSTYAVLAFACGSLMLAPGISRWIRSPESSGVTYTPHPGLAGYCLVAGVAAYLVLATPLARLPTLTALIAAGQQLFIASLCLLCYAAWRQRAWSRFVQWLAVVFALPFITIITRGFMGYGAAAALVVCTFIASFFRPRRTVVLAGLLLSYLGFSFYVNYMRDRVDIRHVVWGQRSFEDRLEQMAYTLANFEWFNPLVDRHLFSIDQRLNQNIFVGAAVQNLGDYGDYAYGQTIGEALLALVPRAVWPDKAIVAGSGDLVSRYTGFRFSEGTSVGIGQVMEFYINFGTLGVVCGFLVLGTVVTVIDRMAGQRLICGDWQSFVLWYLVGMSCLQVGGSFVELVGCAGASLVIVLAMNRYVLLPAQRRAARRNQEWIPS